MNCADTQRNYRANLSDQKFPVPFFKKEKTG